MILYAEVDLDRKTGVFSFYTRTKIFDEAGKKHAAVEIPLPGDAYSVEDLVARTVHADGTVVNFAGRPLRKKKISIKGVTIIEGFSFPDASPGSIVEYKYRLRARPARAQSGSLASLISFAQAVHLITRPQYLYWPERGELFQRQARLVVTLPDLPPAVPGGSKPQVRAENLPPGAQVRLKDEMLTCETASVPAAADEAFPPPKRDAQPYVEIYYPDRKPETPAEFWGEYAERVREAEKTFQSPQKFLLRVTKETVQPDDSPEAKLRKLYARAQAVRNTDFEPLSSEADEKAAGPLEILNAEDVLRSGTGSSQEINRVFVALAQSAGLEAGMARISSRTFHKFELERFDLSQLNTGAVWVRLDGGEILLDPGTPYCPFGLLPWTKAGAGGLLFSKAGWRAFTTRGLAPAETRIERDVRLRYEPAGSLLGLMSVRFSGQEALELRLSAIGKSESERAEAIETRVRSWLPQGAVISRVAALGWDSEEAPLRADLDISIPAAHGPDGEVLLSFFVSGAGTLNPFQSAARADPVQFPFPFEESDQIVIDLASGVTVEKLPVRRGATLDFPGMRVFAPEESSEAGLRRRRPGELVFANYQISGERQQQALIVKRSLNSRLAVVTPEQYPKLREFFSRWKEADSETIVLRAAPAGVP